YSSTERFELSARWFIAVEIADEADAKGDVIEVITMHMAALQLLPPAVANFDFAIARGRSVANDEMVGESILHVPNAAMVVFKGAGVALARPSVVDGDVAPAAFAHTRTVDLGTHRTAQIFPALPPANRWCWLNILRIFFLDGPIGRGW